MRIDIWPFAQAPARYQQLSTHGGDEDYVLVFHDLTEAVPLPYPLEEVAFAGERDAEVGRPYAEGWGFLDCHTVGQDVVVLTAHA